MASTPATRGTLPALVAFDLDYTLWDCWVDTHVDPPLKRRGNAVNQVFDRHGVALSFYPDVPEILQSLKNQVHIAACSRTHAPEVAKQALKQLLLSENKDSAKPNQSRDLKPAIQLFDTLEIYPGSKLTHFKKLHEATGIPYNQMVFFDDEARNAEVERLGVHFVLVPKGLNRQLFDDGLERWRKKHSLD